MALSSKLLINSTHKTKTWWTFVSVLVLVFIPLLIVWLLCGEINLLGNNWLIAKNASLWHGIVKAENITSLSQRYGPFYNGGEVALATELQKWIDKSASIDCSFTIFNPIILAPLFGILIWSIIYPIIFNACKLSGLDVLPFSCAIGSLGFFTIISGLIPQWGQNLMAIYWMVRILICFIAAAIIFFICNRIINKWLVSRDYGFDLVFGYKELERQISGPRGQLKENVDIYKKNKDEDPSYVDVKEGK